MGIGAGPFEGQLVVDIQLAAPGLVAAEQGLGAGADDEFVGGIIAAAGKDRALHGGEDIGFVGAGVDQSERCVQRIVGEACGAFDIGDLGRALDQAQAADEVGRIDDLAEAGSAGWSSRRATRPVMPWVSYSTPMRVPSRSSSLKQIPSDPASDRR